MATRPLDNINVASLSGYGLTSPTSMTSPASYTTPSTIVDPVDLSGTTIPIPQISPSSYYPSGPGGVVPTGAKTTWGDYIASKNSAADNANPSGFGLNLGTLDVAVKGLGVLGGLWSAWQQNKQAKEGLKMQRNLANANLTNQVSAYNMKLEDRIANRVNSGGWDSQRGADYVAAHKLANTRV